MDVGLDYHLCFSRQYNELWEIIWMKKRIELLQNLQRKHKNLEIDFLKARAELKEQYKGLFKNLPGEAKTEFWKNNEQLAKKFLGPNSYMLLKHDMLRSEYIKTREDLEAKYLNVYKPLYAKRSQIVNNIVKDEVAIVDLGANKVITLGKEIPNFWLTTMKNHEVLAQEITQHDEEALKYLKDIKWLKIDGASFRLEFVFQKPNPYFENDVLTKTYHQPLMENTIGCIIKWYHEKDLTRTHMEGILFKKSQRMTKTQESFFNFFDPPELRHEDDHKFDRYSEFYDGKSDRGRDKYRFEEVKRRLRYDYYIGTIFRDKIIPHAISWFTREALEEGGEFEVLEVPSEYADDVDFYKNFLKL